MTTSTEHRRRLVLAAAGALAAITLALGMPVSPARAEPPVPVCFSIKSVHEILAPGAILTNFLNGDSARAFSNAVSDYYHRPHYDLQQVMVVIYPAGYVRLEGFDANGCNFVDARESLVEYEQQRVTAGLPPFSTITPLERPKAAAPKSGADPPGI
jgi:hypothetical protein